MRLGPTSGNDADDFLLISLKESVDDQYNRTRSSRSDRYPALLIVNGEVPCEIA